MGRKGTGKRKEREAEKRDLLFNILVLFLYAAFLLLVISFHEPWYDEAQSWLIARDASFHDLLFRLPHYEGHPSFWWLLLAVPAKLGLPFQIGLRGIQVIFAILGEYLLIFHSPFPRWIRLFLPFTYFFFYQYGIMSRPYSIMLCAVCLAAMTWQERNRKPFRFVLSLMLLCLTCAFGILIAGGIAVVWCLEIFADRSLFRSRRRLVSLILLLLLALVLLAQIIPYPDTYSAHIPAFQETTSKTKQFFMFFFCLPAESMFTAFARDVHLRYFTPSAADLLKMAAVTVPMWIALVLAGRKKRTWLYLFVPYLFVAVFSSFVYFHTHHMGVLVVIFLFYLWISDCRGSLFRKRYAEMAFRVLLVAGFCVNLSWTLYSSVTDLQRDYAVGRKLAAFLTENDLLDRRISYSWWIETDESGNILYENTHVNRSAIDEVNMYLEKPVLDGYMGGQSYADFRDIPQEEMEREKEELREAGVDVVIGKVEDVYFHQLDLDPEDFVKVAELYYDRVWKRKDVFSKVDVLMRRTMAAERVLGEGQDQDD